MYVLVLFYFLGKVVLDLLGLDIDAYYTSEIDAESLLVTSFHYGEMITPLGDVTKITSEKVSWCTSLVLAVSFIGSPLLSSKICVFSIF